MNLFEWIADRTVLSPSTNAIDPQNRVREVISFDGGSFEMWQVDFVSRESSSDSTKIIVLKFPGTGGRAERIGPHPVELWSDISATIWGVNPPGYGTSGGRASVRNVVPVAEASWRHVAENAGDVPVLVVGNSLGCLSALWVAARFPVSGLYLRNPPPLHQLIRQRWRYNCWNFGAAQWVAQRVPQELDAIENARRCHCPVLFVSSEKDRMVPVKFQQRIITAYAGSKQVFTIPDAQHHDGIDERFVECYCQQLNQFRTLCNF